MNIVSLFSGCGGLDLGFTQEGFNIIWANEYDKTIWETYELNHPNTYLDRRDIRVIPPSEIPECDGIIGGSPCQSWSIAGSKKGIDDPRGQLFWDYIKIVRDKQPKFFLAENVKGILSPKNKEAFDNILLEFEKIGYHVSYILLNANNYRVPQDRWRVIIVGIRNDLGKKFIFPNSTYTGLTLNNSIWDLKDEIPVISKDKMTKYHNSINNHECADLGYSSQFMTRNRVRDWSNPSFTILASARHIPLHPQANPMIQIAKDKFKFDTNSLLPYRRLSVRECARIQTFPDDFVFKYNNIINGYKMVGNAVPVNLARVLAEEISIQLNKDTLYSIVL